MQSLGATNFLNYRALKIIQIIVKKKICTAVRQNILTIPLLKCL